nr:hypothetical protein HK105_002820 [Polyrhizophydium stewartii]
MVAGVNHVKSDIVVFCDDDAIWPDTMLAWILAPFEDRQMGGVGTSQTVVTKNKHMTIWEILAAYRISMRNIEITSSTYIDGGVCCLSGRTAAYRTAILRDPKFQWDFTHEFWLGRFHQHSGDDKFLTRWMHSHAWKTYIQCCPQAELASTFKDNWRFLKQLLRWTRNTWRSDIRSLIFERQVWTRHPFVAFSMLDKFFNPVTLLAGPVTVAYLATRHQNALPVWAVLTSYIAWLLITRLIKYMPHFVRRPQDALAIPIWLIFNIVFVIMKIYCLFTLHVTDWGTRQGADDKHDGDNDISEIYVPHWLEDVPDATLARNSSGADEKGAVTETRPALQDAAQHAQQDRYPAGYAAYVPYEQYALQYAITPYPPQPDPVVIQIPQRVQPAPEARNAPVPAAPLRDTFSSISTIEPAYGGAPRGFVSSDDSFAPFAAQPHAHPQARR